MSVTASSFFFFLMDRAPPEIYPLPLHDALPIYGSSAATPPGARMIPAPIVLPTITATPNATPSTCSSRPRDATVVLDTAETADMEAGFGDRKSTRLNSSHSQISYAVFCLEHNST